MAGCIEGRVALLLEYQGSNYAGWQYQINADTVQAQVEKALHGLFGQAIRITGASRTDSGVHARGQVATVDLPSPFPGHKLVPALNWRLPADIRVTKACIVPQDFNPRREATGKIYRYFIFNRPYRPALARQYYWAIPGHLNVTAMNRGAAHLVGYHDFASFQAVGSPVEDTRRTIRHLYCRRGGNIVTVTCVGDGFLYNMMRIIVGSLMEIGLGKQEPQWLGQILAAKDRSCAGPTAPAQGLFLERILYRPSLDSYPQL